MYDYESTWVQPIVPDRRRRRIRRLVLILTALLAVLVMAGGVAVLTEAGAEPPEPAVAAPDGGALPPGAVQLETAPVGDVPASLPLDGEHLSSDADGPAGVGPEPPPADPCTGADPTRLVAKPDPVKLNPGASKGSFVIINCGQQSVDWTAATKPTVALAKASGTVAGGATFELGFVADLSGYAVGPFAFKIKVSQPGANVYVDVQGTKLVSGLIAAPKPTPTPDPGGTLSGGAPAGCAAACITKAWLTPRHGSPDLTLEVKTHTAARIVATVDPQAPVAGPKGHPYLAEADVTRSTGQQYRTEWTTTLTPLQPATKYHIVVRATDAAGRISTQTSSFTTTKPVTGLSAGEAGGCSANCVKSALILPTPGSPDVAVTVRTHVPAAMAVFVDDQAPHRGADGVPSFPGVAPASTTGDQRLTEWATELDLEPATTYFAILKVTDEQSRSQYLEGEFHTPPDPVANHQNQVRVTFHKIHVSNDADNQPLNWRGEMTFLFEVNGERRGELDTGERKVHAPEVVSLDTDGRDPGRSVILTDAPDVLSIRVQGWERDQNLAGYCSAGWPLFDDVSGFTEIDNCFEVEWNTAVGTIDLHPDAGTGALPSCFSFGITADICATLQATGDDPRFDVFIGVDFLD